MSSEADRESSRRGSLESFLLLGMIALYLFISLRNLDTIPPVHEDEPWQASVAWKSITQGILGSDIFAGFYSMERHYYGFMPLNPLFTSMILRIGGLGLFQVRLTSVVLGLLILLLIYSLGRRRFNSRVGLLAVIFILLVQTSSTSRYHLTGIPFLDITRIHRYDPAVAVVGLAALNAYIRARTQGKSCWYLLAGFLAGLSGLAHLYGNFWLPVLLLLALVERVALKYFLAVILGFCLPWLPYILFIAPNFIDWRGQTQFYAERFELLDPAWYWHNQPYQRRPALQPGLSAAQQSHLVQGG
jgi:4-amino-4-deoxy-L-arabinose transferase-like glycosyltransferase